MEMFVKRDPRYVDTKAVRLGHRGLHLLIECQQNTACGREVPCNALASLALASKPDYMISALQKGGFCNPLIEAINIVPQTATVQSDSL